MAGTSAAQNNKKGIIRFLHVVEWLGNALPHPVSLTALFAAGVVVLSGILGYFDVSVVDPRPVGAKGRAGAGAVFIDRFLEEDQVAIGWNALECNAGAGVRSE